MQSNTLRGLCQRTVWLDGGRVMAQGDSIEVTNAYLDFQRDRIGRQLRKEQSGSDAGSVGTRTNADAPVAPVPEKTDEQPAGLPARLGTREAEIYRVEILDEREQPGGVQPRRNDQDPPVLPEPLESGRAEHRRVDLAQ